MLQPVDFHIALSYIIALFYTSPVTQLDHIGAKVDSDAAFDNFLSESSDVRRRASEALEQWRMRDAGGLASALVTRMQAKVVTEGPIDSTAFGWLWHGVPS